MGPGSGRRWRAWHRQGARPSHFALTEFAKTGATFKETPAFGGHSTVVAALRYQHTAADRLAELLNVVPALPNSKQSSVRLITG
ncbi:MAG: hypothetical protein K4304_03095 [Propionicimonas sp.]